VGDAGILIQPGDTGAIVEAVTGLFDNDNKRREMAVNGKERVKRLFNWDNTAQQTADYYKEAIEAQAQVKTG
jgi:glycosyltransferase involved in cell wall biosynthesis